MIIEEKHKAGNSTHDDPVLLSFTEIESGISLFSVEFQPMMKKKQVLLSCALSLLRLMGNLMCHLSFVEIGFVDYTLLMKVRSSLLISYIFRGRTSNANRKLDEFIRHLEEYPTILNSFKSAIATNEIDKGTKSFVENLTTQIFINSEK